MIYKVTRYIFRINSRRKTSGFSLIEIMVSVAVFAVVLTAMMGSIFTVVDANRKSKNLRSVMDNFNLTMDSMTRAIRFGTKYHCGSAGDLTAPNDCGGSGQSSLSVRDANDRLITYSLLSGRIARSIDGSPVVYITSSDVTISTLTFWVYGSSLFGGGSDLLQPQVIIVISGFAGNKVSSRSSFNLETTVSQRQLDFQ